MSGEVKVFARYSYCCKGCILALSLPQHRPISHHTPKPSSSHGSHFFLSHRNHHLLPPPLQTLKTTSPEIPNSQSGGGILLLHTNAHAPGPFPISCLTPHPFFFQFPQYLRACFLIYFQPLFTARFPSNITIFIYDISPFFPPPLQPGERPVFLCK